MAQAINCDTPVHGDEPVPAVLVITNVPEAEVSGLCLDCATGFAIAWLGAFAPEQLAPPEPPKPKPARTRKAPAPEGGTEDGKPAEPRPRPSARKRPANATGAG